MSARIAGALRAAAWLLLGSVVGGPAYAAAPDAPPGEVSVAVDRRVMAVTITAWLAREEGEPQDPMTGLPGYQAALRAHFGPHRDHRAVQLAGQLARAGFTYDAPVGWVLHLDPIRFRPRAEVPAYYAQRAGDADRLEAYRKALADFVREADLDGFLDAMAPLHEAEVERVRSALPQEAVQRLDTFYGTGAPRQRTLLVVPTLGPHHFGPTVRTASGEEHYQLSNTLRHGTDADLQLALDDLVLHEFGHPLAHPVIAAAGDRLAKLGDALLPPIAPAMQEQAYPTWSLVVEEHLVRAVTCRLLRASHGEAVGRSCLAAQVHRGFWYTVPLYEALGAYEASRDRHATLVAFQRTLVRTLEGVARQGARAWWSTTDWRLPRPLNGVVVLPTGDGATPELQQAARALAASRYGGRLLTDTEALWAPEHPYVVVGGPAENRLSAAYAEGWPVAVAPAEVQAGAHRFVGRGLALAARVEGPEVPWTVHWGDGLEGALRSLTLTVHGRGWSVAPSEGPPCAEGHLAPGARRVGAPRALGCAPPEGARGAWVPDALGEAVRWNARVPIELAPERFEASLAEAVAACVPEARVLSIECGEPPCIAALGNVPDGGLARLVGCGPWRVPLGPTVHHLERGAVCDGVRQEVLLVAPTPASLRRAVGEPRLLDRLVYRWARTPSEVGCDPATGTGGMPSALGVR